jgi:hypothetical protein
MHRPASLVMLLAVVAPVRATPPPPLGRDAAGHEFRLESERGQVVAVTLVSRYTRKEAERVTRVLNTRVDDGDVGVVAVVDFIGIPRLFHNYARRKVIEGTRTSRIRWLVDDRGDWRRYFDAHPDKCVDILVLDRQGNLRAHFIGEQQLDAALSTIDRLRTDDLPAMANGHRASRPM